MFVGFIAVVVILLIIVGLMSTGATSGSGGVDQTKATKAISEISALAQSTGFYKTTVDTTNYAGLTVQKLIDNGIVSVNDTVTATATDYDLDAKTTVIDGDVVVASKAVPGLVYKLESDLAGAATTGAASDSYFDIEIAAGTGLSDGLKKALDSTYAKLIANVDGNSDANADNVNDADQVGKDISNSSISDGSAIIAFN